jgi:hypothetical protein
LSLAHLVHYFGFAIAVGASAAAHRVMASSQSHSASEKAGFEGAAADIVTKVELPGLFLAVFGGILLIAANPDVLSPEKSGAGPWLSVKLLFVFGLLVVSHLRMFGLRRLVRARGAGESEADLEARHRKVKTLALVDLLLATVVVFIATCRFVLFA